MDRKRFYKSELLAPAGDLARCKTAIRYGADAVYIGGQQFSLRSRASNFTLEDIKEACAFAKFYGTKIHVTVNIIPHEEDLEGLANYLIELEKAGVHAIIVASVSIMELAKKVAPRLEVHCSTQMSITNATAAKFLQDTLHIDRVVLARECTLQDVKEITSSCEIETEAFIHGGMCVNYSGRCTLSNRMTLRDANRGGCAQSCRWFYHLYEGEKDISKEPLFTMGSKDLCAVSQISSLMEAGLHSLKIEGRMKTEYYIATIVSSYRHMIDEIYETQAPLSTQRMEYYQNLILLGESRETCDGFYSGVAGKDSLIQYENSNQEVNHDFLGTVKSYDADSHIAVIETRNYFENGEILEVLSPTKPLQHFQLTWMKNDQMEYLDQSRHPMALITMEIPFEVQVEDMIRRYRG